MTIKTAKNIEVIVVWVIYIIFLPFGIISLVLLMLKELFDFILKGRDYITFKIGNGLMQLSYDNIVEELEMIHHHIWTSFTAREMWLFIKTKMGR